MKKILKISITLLLICSFLGMNITRGEFQFEIGDKVAYKIVKAGHDISVSTTTDRFVGCSNSGTILDNGTVIIEVTNVTSTQLKWNSTNLTPELTGTCPSDLDQNSIFDFLMDGYEFISSEFDVVSITGSGNITPIYFIPFEAPLFVDPKPVTWLIFESMETNLGLSIAMLFIGWTVHTLDLTYSGVNNQMNLSLDLAVENIIDVDNSLSLNTQTHLCYNMTSGALLEASIYYTVYGDYASAPFVSYSEYEIKQTAIPPDEFNFLNFLKENKWYFIGGSAGVVVIGAVAGIAYGFGKAKGSTKKSSKKSSSKKKSTKKKK